MTKMNMTRLLIPTRKEAPSEIESLSHSLLVRGGYITQLISGVYTYLLLGLRIKNKIINIVREEMDYTHANEILMPALQPLEYWEQSDRRRAFGEILFSLQDRKNRELILGPTHEEVVSKLFAENVDTYKQLPLTLYQIQTKFRDEARPRGGLIRVREFTMKDAYSFDLTDKSLEDSYQKMVQAYENIFYRCGLPVVKIDADSGAIGGKGSQEFIYLHSTGEDTVIMCECGYAANEEKAQIKIETNKKEKTIDYTKIETKNITTINKLSDFFDLPKSKFLKAVLYIAKNEAMEDIPIIALIRGDLEINEVKLTNIIKLSGIRNMNDDEIKSYGMVPGFTGPIGIDKNIQVVADASVVPSYNLISGSNEINYHYLNTNYDKDWKADIIGDIHLAVDGALCQLCGKQLSSKKGIEIGHVFKLGQLYSEKFNIKVSGSNQDTITPTMGCYGIGIDRILASAAENTLKKDSLNWPITIAPFHVHIIFLGDEELSNSAIKLTIDTIEDSGLEILIDDRNETPGKKFADADLLGIPIRILISKRNTANGEVEIINRTTQKTTFAPIESFNDDVLDIYSELLNTYTV
ncbi:MAG: proline--tRNA ligase [Dehalococcoidia bacterium]|nr:proline--tRNA ligase [Dehalococcoidia bacterium]